MNIGELKLLIEDLDDDIEVRIMHQYSWPFEYSIGNSILASEIVEREIHEEEGERPFVPYGCELVIEGEDTSEGLPDSDILYLTDGTQLGYGTKAAWA